MSNGERERGRGGRESEIVSVRARGKTIRASDGRRERDDGESEIEEKCWRG